MSSFDAFALLWAGPWIVGIALIDVFVALDNWRYDRRKRNERSGGDGA